MLFSWGASPTAWVDSKPKSLRQQGGNPSPRRVFSILFIDTTETQLIGYAASKHHCACLRAVDSLWQHMSNSQDSRRRLRALINST